MVRNKSNSDTSEHALIDEIRFGSHFVGASWQLARREISDALKNDHPALVLGEVGTGRVALIREAAAKSAAKVQLVVIDACNLHAVHELRSFAAKKFADATSPDTATTKQVLVLRCADRLPARHIEAAKTLLRTASVAGKHTLIMLTGELQDGEPGGALIHLLPYLSTTVYVPPLRHRTADFASITQHIMESISQGSFARLSSTALDTLRRGYWPGNLHQLAAALSSAIAKSTARGGERAAIEVEDLPSHAIYTALRQLSQLEIMERRTIIAALYRAGGNRAAAARELGISRATLYRRLTDYGLL